VGQTLTVRRLQLLLSLRHVLVGEAQLLQARPVA
jgi:hypothetical protein